MTVFNIYAGADDRDAELRGTMLAGELFGKIWKEETTDEDGNTVFKIKAGDVYEELIYRLINNHACRVVYNRRNKDYKVYAVKAGGKKVVYYKKDNKDDGEEIALQLKVVQDNPNDNVINMAVPWRRDAKYDDPYLGNAVNRLSRPESQAELACKPGEPILSADDKKKFLFGLLLLKRCR